MRRLFAIAAIVVSAAACKSQQLTTTSSLATPIGLAVSGTTAKHVFIANAEEDTLQMLELPDLLQNITFVRGPSRYFPLRIPAGVRPTKLAASNDARYVIVLDSGTSSLLLIDADALLKAVDANDSDISFILSDAGSTPVDMVAAPPCAGPPKDLESNVGKLLGDQVRDSGAVAPSSARPRVDGTCPQGNGRVFVALAADGLILQVDLHDLRDANGAKIGAEFVPTAAYNVGGQPQRLAVSHDGGFLFVSDGLQPVVERVDLSSGKVDTLDVGGLAGPLAVSQDNGVLLVGRPQWQDILVVQQPTSPTWGVFDADSLHAPLPVCIVDCASGQNVDDPNTPCTHLHPADAEICRGAGGLEQRPGKLYTGISVDAAPVLIATLGVIVNNYALTYNCTDGDVDVNNDGTISTEENNRNSAIERRYEEYAVVVTEGDRTAGDILWLPLREIEGASLVPQVANGACGKAALDVDARFVLNNAVVDNFGPYQIANYMDHCVTVPDRARFSCVEDANGGGAVVLAGNMPIVTSQTSGPLARQGRWDFTWEMVIPRLDRSSGGGQFADNVQEFFDVGLTPEDVENVQPGDILEIMSLPTNDADCIDALATQSNNDPTSEQTCYFERTITTAPAPSDPDDPNFAGHIHFQYSGAKVPPTCFLAGGRVGYRIRAGNQFMVTRTGMEPWRMKLTDLFGPGGTVANAQHEPAIFRFRSDLPNLFEGPSPDDPAFTNTGADAPAPAQNNSACARYDQNGHVLPGAAQSELLSRDVRFSMLITDAFRPYVSGRSYSATGATLGSAGSIPGDIVVWQDPVQNLPAKMFVTFSGANTLVGMDPTDATNATAGLINTQIILQN